jgi:hypothetical protein
MLATSEEKTDEQMISRESNFDLLKNFVLEKGDVSKRNLIESPFTMLHPEGIRGIFNQKEIDEIIDVIEVLTDSPRPRKYWML